MVQAPSRAKATSTTMACGSSRSTTSPVAITAPAVCAARECSGMRVAPPLPEVAYSRRRCSQRSSTSATTALSASTVVSTYASPIAPVSFEA